MSEQENGFFGGEIHSSGQAFDVLARLLRVAEPSAVYGEPVVQGDRTVILASELTASAGVGYGYGSDADHPENGGGGGGGGGFAAGRPVAAVVIEPGGVHVEPVVDVTKLGIAFFTTIAAMFLAWSRMRRVLNSGKK